jgi:hypothetical protein
MSAHSMCWCRWLRLAGIIGLMLLVASVADAAMAQAPLGAGPPFLISSVQRTDRAPAVAYNPGHHLYVVVWEKNGAIRGRVVDERGALLHEEFVANGLFDAQDGGSPDVAYNAASNTFLIVWSQYVRSTLRQDIYAQRLRGDGWEVQGQFQVSLAGWAYGPRVAANPHDSEFLVVWYTMWDIVGQRIRAASGGSDRIGDEIQVAVGSSGAGNNVGYDTPDVAYHASQNRYLVVYRRYKPDLGPREWDICGRMVNAAGTTSASQIIIDDTPQAQYGPAVAACALDPAHPFLVVYNDEFDQYHNTGKIYVTGRLLNNEGNPVPQRTFITYPDTVFESNPAIAASDGFGYTVVWQQEDESPRRIWGCRVKSDASLEAAFEISARAGAPAGSQQQFPAIAGGSPTALVVWQDSGWGSGTWDIAGRLLGFRAQLPVIRR